MTIFTHLYPANVIGVSPPMNPEQGCFVVQDVSRGIYAQTSAAPIPPTLVGYIPALSDGSGGIAQLARALDIRYNRGQDATGVTAALTGTSLTVTYPSQSIMWDGVVQVVQAGSITGTVSTGVTMLCIAFAWGLNQPSLRPFTADVILDVIELAEIRVDTTAGTALVTPPRANGVFLGKYGVATSTGGSNFIPVSDATGKVSW